MSRDTLIKAGLFSLVRRVSFLLSVFGPFFLLRTTLVLSQKYVEMFLSSLDGPTLSQRVGLAGQGARALPLRLRVRDSTVFIWIKHSS